jgi:hypothetical protein
LADALEGRFGPRNKPGEGLDAPQLNNVVVVKETI